MAIFGKTTGGGIMDVIRCDEPNYLVWKWHPEGTVAGGNNKENAIRWGSPLRVKDGSVAVFVYSDEQGFHQDYIEGPFDDILETSNLPIIANIVGLAYAGGAPFQAEVYFINLAEIIQLKFAVPYFDVFDPRFLDFGVPTAVRGVISFKITDYMQFIKLHRLDAFSLEDFRSQVKDAVSRYVKATVSNAPEENNIPVIQLERKIDTINDIVEKRIKERLNEEFGVTVSSVDISAIEIDKSSTGYKELSSVTKDLTAATAKAQTEVGIKEMKDSQKLGILERAGRAFVDIKEDAYARRKKTQTANFSAYQTEAQEHVGVAGAEGLGKMGSGDGSGGGMNPASMMTGMVVGSTIGQNIAGAMSGVMQKLSPSKEDEAENDSTPPPIPKIQYHVALNGNAEGPYDMSTIELMIKDGKINDSTLVWKEGLEDWVKAEDEEAIATLILANTQQSPPPIPQQ